MPNTSLYVTMPLLILQLLHNTWHRHMWTATVTRRLEATFQGSLFPGTQSIYKFAEAALSSMLFRLEYMQPGDMFTYTDWGATVKLLSMQLRDWRMLLERACDLISWNPQVSLAGTCCVW